MLSARKTARFVVRKEVLINDSVRGHALDISETGMFIHTHIPFPVGRQVMLDFTLESGGAPFHIKGLVQHVSPGVGVGIMFSNPPPAELERIKKFVETSCEDSTDVRKKILIVDDSATVRMMFKGCIELMGCEVREASDGKEALAAIAQRRPDLILLDLFMEGMDGFQFLEVLRSDEGNKDLKVVVLTGTMTPDVKTRVAPFGALDFLPKMMTTPKKLAEKISEYLV